MAGGGGEGKTWIALLAGGGVMVAIATVAAGVLPGFVHAGLLGLGGLFVVFGSCEALIKAVEGVAVRLRMNEFVAGTMAGLASNVPELVMLGFVLAAAPRVGFIVTVLTLHVGTAAFGVYSALLPRDETGHARLPEPLVKHSTDMYACAGAAFFVLGTIMVLMNVFDAGDHRGEALGAVDLFVLGGALLSVEAISVTMLVKRFSGAAQGEDPASTPASTSTPARDAPSVGAIVLYGLLGIGTSVLGGHSVGDFADVLVASLDDAGYPEMFGALILSVFAASGALVMIVTAHFKGKHDVALASASAQVSQVPFVVLPVAMICLGVFGSTGVIPRTEHGGILPIDLETTSVLLLSFPPFLVMWKAVQDDGKLNRVETATMTAIFGLVIYFLAMHG
jgi:hypothetical protein